MMSLDSCLAGHGGHLFIDDVRVMYRHILREPVDHLCQQFLLGNGKQVGRYAAHRVFPAAKGFYLKTDSREIIHIFLQEKFFVHVQC